MGKKWGFTGELSPECLTLSKKGLSSEAFELWEEILRNSTCQWISCEEALPVPLKSVLVSDGYWVEISSFEGSGWYPPFMRGISWKGVKYWMPLPVSPEKENGR